MIGYIFHATILSTREMFRKNQDLSAFTHQTDHHEPNLSFHFAIELWKYFPWLNCDFDVKKTAENKRPDIIFHKRGTSDRNFLVVEVKRKSNADVRDWFCIADQNKIRDDWFGLALHYPFGLSIVLDERTFEFSVALLTNGSDGVTRFESRECSRDFPANDRLDALMTQVSDEKRAAINADTAAREVEIDELVHRLYGLTD